MRHFGEQVKHVACAQFGFFNEFEGKKPPDGREKGGHDPAKTKAELIKYLKDSFDYSNRVLATLNAKNALERIEGRYAGPSTKLGISVVAVWYIADAWQATVAHAPQNNPPTIPYWTAPSVRRVALTINDFAHGSAKLTSNPAWMQTHSDWRRGGDCATVGPGTDTGPAPNRVALDSLGVSLVRSGRSNDGIQQIKRAFALIKRIRPTGATLHGRMRLTEV